MSLYIGKPTTESLLHITKGVTPLASMTNGPIESTVFHSSLEFMTATNIYDALEISGKNIRVPSAAITKLIDGYLFIVLLKTDKTGGEWTCYSPPYDQSYSYWTVSSGIPSGASISFGYATTSVTNGDMTLVSRVPEVGRNWICMRNVYSLPYFRYDWITYTVLEAKLVILNVKNRVYEPPVKSSQEVKVDKTQMIIGGVDLKNIRYLHNEEINDADLLFYTNNDNFQIINSTPTSGDVSISCVGGVSEISYGGKTIVTSNVTNPHLLFAGTDTVMVPANTYNTGSDRSVSYILTLLPSGTFVSGDSILYTLDFNGDVGGNAFASSGIAKYVDGMISFFASERKSYFRIVGNMVEVWANSSTLFYLYGTPSGGLELHTVVTNSENITTSNNKLTMCMYTFG